MVKAVTASTQGVQSETVRVGQGRLKTDVALKSLNSAVSANLKHSRATGSPLAISRTRNGHLNHPIVNRVRNARWPKRGDPQGHGVPVVVRGRASCKACRWNEGTARRSGSVPPRPVQAGSEPRGVAAG